MRWPSEPGRRHHGGSPAEIHESRRRGILETHHLPCRDVSNASILYRATVAPLPPSPQIDAKDLRLVLALAQHGTTASAAKVLHLAQPSVSRALLSLEERLDVVLFDRTAQGLVLTDAGRQIATRATELLEGLIALERAVRAPARERRRVRMVCECYTAYHWLPSTLAALQQDIADVELRLRVQHTTDPLSALETGEIDAALLTSPCKSGSGLKTRDLWSDEIVFVVANTHPLASKPTLTTADIEQTPLFTQRAPVHEAEWFMRSVFGRRRPRINVTNVPLTEAAIDLARAGMGIAVLTEWVIKPYLGREGFVAKRLDKGPLLRDWRLTWRTEIGDIGPRLHRALQASFVP